MEVYTWGPGEPGLTIDCGEFIDRYLLKCLTATGKLTHSTGDCNEGNEQNKLLHHRNKLHGPF